MEVASVLIGSNSCVCDVVTEKQDERVPCRIVGGLGPSN
jgi:hypothetical protein